jgi:hypothetical protein
VTPILTLAGEFAAPYLIKEATKLGIKKFIQNYGSTAFQAISIGVVGGMIEQIAEPVDLQNEKLFGMPVRHIIGQEQVYDDTKYFKKPEPLKFGQWIGPDADAMEREKQKIAEREKERLKGPPPIAPAPPLITPVPKEKKFEPPSSPPVELPELEGFPDLSEELNKPQIFTKDKPKDITKQTEELVPSEDKLNEKELRFLKDVSLYRDISKPLDKKIKKLVAGEEVVFTENEHFKLRRLTDAHTNQEGMDVDTDEGIQWYEWEDVYGGGEYAKGFFKSDTEYENFIVKLRHLTTLAKGRTWKPEQLKFKDITKQTKDLVKEEPEFGALTEVEKQTAIALKGDKPDFYSRAIKSIEDAKPDKLTKTKWKSYIQSTKEELDYLGLTDFLKGNESITKQELLDFVKGKDIAATMIVYPIPKIEMNPMYEDYSLGFEKSGTQEHIVFQIGKDKGEVGQLYKEPHLNIKHGTGTFAHSRVQVGYDPNITSEHKKEAKYTGEDIKLKKFNNTLIIDEIQSQWIQTGQDKGFVSDFDIVPGENLLEYLKNNNIEYRISGKGKNTRDIEMQGKPGVWEDELGSDPFNENMDYIFNKNEKSLRFIYDPEEETKYSTPEEFLQKAYGIVPDLPLKDSKKFVELVLNEMIRKAVKDGRDSIAITNGQIQYNRYEAMGEKERQGLKKFYDTFVYDQLNKIAKNYGVKLERIDIGEGEAPKELQDIRLDNKIKTAQDNDYILKKITFQELFDRVQDTDIPGHAALYSNEGRGQGHGYIEEWFNTLIDNRTGGIPATLTTEEGLSDSGLKRWEKVKNNEVYVWKKGTNDIGEEGVISWDMPIVPVKDTSAPGHSILTRPGVTGENDLSIYTEYLKAWKPPEGIDLSYEQDPEQLIKMKLPKKLQNDILKKSIRLTEVKPPIEDQTQRLFT